MFNLRVMSFNLRYGTAEDGENSWSHRWSLVEPTIRQFGPDLLGTQEGVDFQIEHLRFKLSDYTFVGAKREEHSDRAEYVGIFFRTSRFTLRNSEHFWLSENPEVVGSLGWDSRLPRMVTWCELIDTCARQQPIYFFNTHLDWEGKTAQYEGALLLRRRIDSLGADCGIVVAGDFNSNEDDPPYHALVSATNESAPANQLVDSYRAANPCRSTDELTRHDFGGCSEGSRIDWILHSQHYSTIEANIDRTTFDGRYPSDHYPVTAVLQLK